MIWKQFHYLMSAPTALSLSLSILENLFLKPRKEQISASAHLLLWKKCTKTPRIGIYHALKVRVKTPYLVTQLVKKIRLARPTTFCISAPGWWCSPPRSPPGHTTALVAAGSFIYFVAKDTCVSKYNDRLQPTHDPDIDAKAMMTNPDI